MEKLLLLVVSIALAVFGRIAKRWRPLGFAIRHGERGGLLAGDVEIDWDAGEVKRAIASRRAMASWEN